MFKKTLLIWCCAASAIPSYAQDATFLNFADQPISERFVLAEVGIVSKQANPVEKEMMALLAQPIETSQNPGEQFVRAGRPKVHYLAPGWLKGSHFSRIPDLSNTASNKLLDKMTYVRLRSGNCSAQYRPSGLLSRSAEARRAKYYSSMVLAACGAGIPVDLYDALIMQESRYNPHAVSPAGARGLSQLMPGTARYVGTLNSFSPQDNLRGGARYLREQIDRFGLTPRALAAYNAGPGSVSQYGGIPPFKETRNYVKIVLKNLLKLSETRLMSEAARALPVTYPGQGVGPSLAAPRNSRASQLLFFSR